MYAHGGALPPSPVQSSVLTAVATAGHRYTRRSRRPVDLDAGRSSLVTVSHLGAGAVRDRITRPATAPVHRDELR